MDRAPDQPWRWGQERLHLRCVHARRDAFTHALDQTNGMSFHRLFLVAPTSPRGSRVDSSPHSILLAPGTVTLLPSHLRYRFRFVPGFQLVGFHFRLENGLGHDLLQDLTLRQDRDPDLAARAWSALALDGPGAWLRAEAVLRQGLGERLTDTWSAFAARAQILGEWAPVLSRIENAGASGPDVVGLATAFGLSRERFSRRFRDRFHRTPRDYHRDHLASRVRDALLADDAPLADIAARFGFSDAFALSRFVRRSLGQNPSALRRSGPLA